MNNIIPNDETARRAVQRIARLERRLRQIDINRKTEQQAGEISALKWAIPILEEYVEFKYGKSPNKRMELWKHEYIAIKENLSKDYGNVCYICGVKKKIKNLTIDHFIPLDAGGKDNYSNYRLACSPCNTEKGNKVYDTSRS